MSTVDDGRRVAEAVGGAADGVRDARVLLVVSHFGSVRQRKEGRTGDPARREGIDCASRRAG
ncbi:hypothetical protein GCM10010377_75300 [Streptomyces viridiviolaceus]|nr:hypothetical protein GCM10010377_75300 [Streptomyces viridiviolaceus]